MKADASLTTNDRLTRLETTVAGLEVGQGQIVQELRDIKGALSRGTNWPLLLSALGVVLAIFLPSVGALALFISLQIKTEVSPLQSKADISVRDRMELHTAAGRLEDLLNEINSRERESTAGLRAATVELETQLRANSQISNAFRSFQQQNLAILWREAKGYDMPQFAYYPDISLPKPQTPQ